MKISRYFIYIIWLTLFGCSPTYTLQLHEEKVIGIQAENDSSIMAIIYPYQKAIESLEKTIKLRTQDGFFKSKVPTQPLRKITPSEVYEIVERLDSSITLLIQRNYDKSQKLFHHVIKKKRYIDKTPSDVYFNLSLISRSIDELTGTQYSPNETNVLALEIEKKIDTILSFFNIKIDFGEEKEFSNKIKTVTQGQGVDVIFDPVGGAYCEPALRAIAWKGRYLVIGFTSSIPSIPLNLALLKGCQIIGVFWGNFCVKEPLVNADNFKDLFKMFENQQIKPFVVETYPLEKTAHAIELLANREALGKIAIKIRD